MLSNIFTVWSAGQSNHRARRFLQTGAGRLIRALACLTLLIFALTTPGFLTSTSLFSLLTSASFVGCVAVGMTFITLSGNLMSFSLGATMSATTLVFVACFPLGLAPAMLIACLFGSIVSILQGWVVGYFGANPIIVSLAAFAFIDGIATLLTGGHGVYPARNIATGLTTHIGPLPAPLVMFLGVALLGQFVLSRTELGRNLYLVGSNRRAARAAGLETYHTAMAAYGVAGLCAAASAILIAARYSSGDMEFGAGYDYQAISAVLVGGTAIQGGQGSVTRTVAGTLLIAAVQGVLLLRGFSTQTQHLLIGLIVLGAILLQSRGGTR